MAVENIDWDTILYVWDGAKYVPQNTVDKARQRQFASRSEAGAYAARIRWGNRNQAVDPMEDLRTSIADVQAQLSAITWDTLEEASDWQTMAQAGPDTIDGTDTWLVRLDSTSPDQDEVMVGTKAIKLEASVTALGAKAFAIADKRLADRGVTPELVADARRAKMSELKDARAEFDALQASHQGSKWNRVQLTLKVKRGQMTEDERDAIVKDYTAQAKVIKDRHLKLRQELDSPDYNLDAARSAEARKVLAEVRGVGTAPQFKDVQTASGATRAVKPITESIANLYPSSHVESMNSEAGLTLKVLRQGSGGSYNHGDRVMRIELAPAVSKSLGAGSDGRGFGSVAVHEYGHATAFHRPGVMVAEQAFYQRRTRGILTHEGPVASKMAGTRREPAIPVGPNIVVRPDMFVREYVGRDYSANVRMNLANDPKSRIMGTKRFFPTETFTEGVEALSGLNTQTLHADQDHKNFALGILLGLP